MSRRTRTRTCVLVLSVALLAAACSSDEDSRIQTTDAGATRDATASPSSSASAAGPQPTDEPSGSRVEAAGGEGQAYVQPGATSRKAGEGNGLSVVDVRTGTHDGYDRVVLELGGEGTVGWRVAYDAAPATQGEGAPVELVGDATLSVLLENVGYPFDTGVEEYGGDTQPAPDLPQIKELRLGGVFEGYYDAFVGVGEQAPFRVFRLTDPQRVVVDVQQP